ncbi:MAG: hypothetical protein ACLFUF_06530 [Opitutales bacterium]
MSVSLHNSSPSPSQTRIEELSDGTVILSSLPPDFDAGRLRKEMRCHPGSTDEARFEEMLACAVANGRPKGLYRPCLIEARQENDVTVQGVTFSGPLLRRQLDGVHRVFPFVVTCGRELDAYAPPPGDVLENYYWGRICTAILRRAHTNLRRDLRHRFQVPRTSYISPGSGDPWLWPLEQLPRIFDLLGEIPDRIGVEVKPTCAMIPKKTLAGFHYASATEFHTCRACHLEACPDRLAPLDPDFWNELRQDL